MLLAVTVDMAAEVIRHSGRGTLLVKIDLESGYRQVTVHLADRLHELERRTMWTQPCLLV